MEKKNSHYLINLGKFICALLVVLLHIISDKDIFGYILSVTARISVPFFFMCSGYFLYNKFYESDINKRKKNVFKYIYKIFKIYLISSLVYMVFDYKFYFANDNKIKGSIILVRDFIFISTHYHLWYLISLCFAIYILYLLTKKMKFKNILIIAIIIYFFALISDIYYGIIRNTIFGQIIDVYEYLFGSIGNSFAVALIFMLIGMEIKRYKIVCKKGMLKYFVLVYILFIAENYILKYFYIAKDNNTSMFLVVLIPIIFVSLLGLEEKNKFSYIKNYSDLLKSLSITIYIIHPMVIKIIHPLISKILEELNLYIVAYIEYILVSLICIVIGYIFWKKYKDTKIKSKINKFNYN